MPKGFRHTEEYKINLSNRMKGNKYALGKKLSEEARQKISKFRKERFKKYGFLLSLKTRKKISEVLTGKSNFKISGKNHHNWKGGISKDKGRYSIRFKILKRDNFTCQYCGRKAPDVVLNVDHIIPKSKGGLDKLENLKTSCRECNIGKGNLI